MKSLPVIKKQISARGKAVSVSKILIICVLNSIMRKFRKNGTYLHRRYFVYNALETVFNIGFAFPTQKFKSIYPLLMWSISPRWYGRDGPHLIFLFYSVKQNTDTFQRQGQ